MKYKKLIFALLIIAILFSAFSFLYERSSRGTLRATATFCGGGQGVLKIRRDYRGGLPCLAGDKEPYFKPDYQLFYISLATLAAVSIATVAVSHKKARR